MNNQGTAIKKLFSLITESCNTIAAYSVVILIILFFPVRSAAVHNKYHELAAEVCVPIACLLAVVCCGQILIYFKDFHTQFDKGIQRIIFGVISIAITLLLCFVGIGILYFSLQQLNALSI